MTVSNRMLKVNPTVGSKLEFISVQKNQRTVIEVKVPRFKPRI